MLAKWAGKYLTSKFLPEMVVPEAPEFDVRDKEQGALLFRQYRDIVTSCSCGPARTAVIGQLFGMTGYIKQHTETHIGQPN